MGDDWVLVTRPIVRIVDRPSFGLDDTSLSLFATPRPFPRDRFTYGFGPSALLPTATGPESGTRKWSAGPAGVVVWTLGPWVMGALASNVWSFAGAKGRENVNLLTAQPFLYFNVKGGWAVGSSPILTVEWEQRDRVTVPVGATIQKTFRIEQSGFQASAGAYWNVVRPADGPDAQMRFSVAMLFPK
jgi:hypothetical protein